MGAGRLILAVAAVVAAAGCSSPSQPSIPPGGSSDARVGRIGDGDSFRLADGREVRLLQVDAPELNPDCYGRDAKRALERILRKGAPIRLERDPALDDRDRYGRLLRYVWRGDENVNLRLVELGAASPYFFRNERGAHAAELLDAAKRARADHAGLWGACPRAELSPGLGSVTGPASSQRG